MRVIQLYTLALTSLCTVDVAYSWSNTPTRTFVPRDSPNSCVYIPQDALTFFGCDAPKCICLNGGETMLQWVDNSGDADIVNAVKSYGDVAVANNLQALYTAHTCSYPPHAVPIQCDPNCSFTCNSPYVLQSGSCVLRPSSGVTKKKRDSKKNAKRDALTLNDDFSGIEKEEDIFGAKCEWGFTKCGILNSEWREDGLGFECVDTNSDLESCGGCAVPFSSHSSGPLGTDCTSIPGVSDVECVRGACVVKRCAKGWDVQPMAGNPTALECIPKQRESSKEF